MALLGSNKSETAGSAGPLRHHHVVVVSGGKSTSDEDGAGDLGGQGDYGALGTFLATRAGRGGSTITLAFTHVEQVLGRPLPPAARRHRQWWGNDRQHVQARAWLGTGWRSGPVDVTGGWVTFTRDLTKSEGPS